MTNKALAFLPAFALAAIVAGSGSACAAPLPGDRAGYATATASPSRTADRAETVRTAGTSGAAAGGSGPRAAGAAGARGVYGDYSRMSTRTAGQYWSGGRAAGQWAWKPAHDYDRVSWGDPKAWPPSSSERFYHDRTWVYLVGYDEAHGLNRQVVTREEVGDAACHHMKAIPSHAGNQHYARWNVGTSAYCLKAWGYIKTPNGNVRFYHGQVWSPPASCRNRYLGTRTCIRQHERWDDDKNDDGKNPAHHLRTRIVRDQYLARGVGMAFMIRQTVPSRWAADLKTTWHY